MKALVTVISGLMVGLSLASSNFTPIHELKNFLVNKRRIFISLGMAVTAFVFVVSALILALVEWALQYDAQGFIVWTSLFTVAAGLAIAGVLFAVIAVTAVPARVEQSESVFTELNKQFHITEVVEKVLRHLAETRPADDSPPAARPSSEMRPEPRVNDLDLNREMIHH